jgi:EcoEI R protein C-terminal
MAIPPALAPTARAVGQPAPCRRAHSGFSNTILIEPLSILRAFRLTAGPPQVGRKEEAAQLCQPRLETIDFSKSHAILFLTATPSSGPKLHFPAPSSPSSLALPTPQHEGHVAIHRLRTNKALTASDLNELERMLSLNGVGDPATIQKAKEESQGLGLFVRSLVGLDRGAAKEAFAQFLAGTTLGANQIEFVDMIINHLTEHGVMSAALLYESPFTDVTPHGPDGLFTSAQVDDLVSILDQVRATALAS